MAATYKYKNKATGTVSTLSSVRFGELGLIETSEQGASATSQVFIDDKAGTHDYIGGQYFTVDEPTAPVNNRRIHTSYTGIQNIDRGKTRPGGGFVQGAGRVFQIDLSDLNTILHFRLEESYGASRPAESVGTRLAWFLALPEVTAIGLVDGGLVDYPSDSLSKRKYKSSFLDEILNEFAQTTGYNYAVYYKESTDEFALYFKDDRGSHYDSGVSFSNDPTEISYGSIYPIWDDAKLTRDPRRQVSGVDVPYSRGHIYVTRASTATGVVWRDGNAPNNGAKTASHATAIGKRYLTDNKTQQERLTWTATLAAADVNIVKPLQIASVHATHLPGFTLPRNVRVMKRTVKQKVPSLYDVTYEGNGIPGGGVGGVGVTQTATERHQDDVTFASKTTVGHLLVYLASWRQILTAPQPPLGESWTFIDSASFVDDHDAPDPCMVSLYAAMVTTPVFAYTKQSATGGDANGTIIDSVMWEVHGATVADLASYAGAGFGSILNIGSIGSCRLALGAWGNGWDGFFVDPTGVQATTPGAGWTIDYYASRDYDAVTNTAFLAGFPCTWYGHAGASGGLSAISTIADPNAPHHWGGVVVKIP